jgi:lipopolysaccharide biosynthesis regulator YciM
MIMKKTEIAVPNPIFESAQQLARRMNVSMSELYTAALAAYVASHQDKAVTDKLNEVYEGEPSSLDTELVVMQVSSIDGENW